MTNYGRVRSTVKPENIVIDDFSVWQHTDIQEISENVGEENEFIGFEYTMIQYEKDEYIKQMDEKNQQLEGQITDTQIALCEAYEAILGGVQ